MHNLIYVDVLGHQDELNIYVFFILKEQKKNHLIPFHILYISKGHKS